MSVSIFSLTALGVAPASNDVVPIVDVSDTTQSPQGTTKKITVANLFTSVTVTTSLTVTGTATVSSTLDILGSFTINTTKFQVAASTGNVLVAGTLGVTGVGSFTASLSVGTFITAGGAIQTTAGSFAVGSIYKSATLGLAIAGATGSPNDITLRSPADTTIFAVPTGTLNIALAGGITSSAPTGVGIGYATGAGGAVTQATNRVTGVTLDKLAGAITTNNASLAAEAAASFVVTNSTVAIGDTVSLSQRSGSNGGNTVVYVSGVAAGSFTITVSNNNPSAGTAETGAIILNYAVVKAVSA